MAGPGAPPISPLGLVQQATAGATAAAPSVPPNLVAQQAGNILGVGQAGWTPALGLLPRPGVGANLQSLLSAMQLGQARGRLQQVLSMLMQMLAARARGQAGGGEGAWGGEVPYGDLIDRKLAQMGALDPTLSRIAKAIMMAESGGNPDAVGDNGASIGLFQIHEVHGIPAALRRDPEFNAGWALARIVPAYHQGVAQGLSGEELVRFVYDRAINPGGGWRRQGDSVVSWYRRLGGS